MILQINNIINFITDLDDEILKKFPSSCISLISLLLFLSNILDYQYFTTLLFLIIHPNTSKNLHHFNLNYTHKSYKKI